MHDQATKPAEHPETDADKAGGKSGQTDGLLDEEDDYTEKAASLTTENSLMTNYSNVGLAKEEEESGFKSATLQI